jgi:hypothetical protein
MRSGRISRALSSKTSQLAAVRRAMIGWRRTRSSGSPARRTPWRDLPAHRDAWNSAFFDNIDAGRRRASGTSRWRLSPRARRATTRCSGSIPPFSGGAPGARRKRAMQRNALGRRRGGFMAKIRARANGDGLPLALTLTLGQASDAASDSDDSPFVPILARYGLLAPHRTRSD